LAAFACKHVPMTTVGSHTNARKTVANAAEAIAKAQ